MDRRDPPKSWLLHPLDGCRMQSWTMRCFVGKRCWYCFANTTATVNGTSTDTGTAAVNNPTKVQGADFCTEWMGAVCNLGQCAAAQEKT